MKRIPILPSQRRFATTVPTVPGKEHGGTHRMRVRFRAATTVLSATALIGAVLVGVANPAAAAVPPWENPPANELGQIRFYDSSGNAVTGGNITDDPFALYAVATSDDPQSANTTATMFAYTPV